MMLDAPCSDGGLCEEQIAVTSKHGRCPLSANIVVCKETFQCIVFQRQYYTVIVSNNIITGRICRRQLCRYCFYSSRADFGVFRPAGATRCTDQGGIWHGGADRRSAPPCQTPPWSVQGWGFMATKTKKNWNFTNIIAPKGRVPCTIFQNLQVLCAYSVYIILPNMAALFR